MSRETNRAIAGLARGRPRGRSCVGRDTVMNEAPEMERQNWQLLRPGRYICPGGPTRHGTVFMPFHVADEDIPPARSFLLPFLITGAYLGCR